GSVRAPPRRAGPGGSQPGRAAGPARARRAPRRKARAARPRRLGPPLALLHAGRPLAPRGLRDPRDRPRGLRGDGSAGHAPRRSARRGVLDPGGATPPAEPRGGGHPRGAHALAGARPAAALAAPRGAPSAPPAGAQPRPPPGLARLE